LGQPGVTAETPKVVAFAADAVIADTNETVAEKPELIA
jgi:hypothetical protein